MYVCMYVCMIITYVCMYVCMYICCMTCMYDHYVCMCVCLYACMYACIYVCMYASVTQLRNKRNIMCNSFHTLRREIASRQNSDSGLCLSCSELLRPALHGMNVCMYMRMYVCMGVWMYVSINACLCMYVM